MGALRESRDLSLEIFEPPCAFAAIDEMARTFDVKSPDLKSAALGTLKKGAKNALLLDAAVRSRLLEGFPPPSAGKEEEALQ